MGWGETAILAWRADPFHAEEQARAQWLQGLTTCDRRIVPLVVQAVEFYWRRSWRLEELEPKEFSGWTLPKYAEHVTSTEKVRRTEKVQDGYTSDYRSKWNYKEKRYEVVETKTPRMVDRPVYGTYYTYWADVYMTVDTGERIGRDQAPSWEGLPVAKDRQQVVQEDLYQVIFESSNGRRFTETLALEPWLAMRVGESAQWGVDGCGNEYGRSP